MANNYQEFSEQLIIENAEEELWLKEQLTEDEETNVLKFLEDYPDEDMREYCSFSYAFEEAGNERYLWIYADESGDPDCVVHLVQKFLKKFRSDGCWSMTYSCTCSKPRIGEFGGGAAFVTADNVEWCSTYSFIHDKTKEFLDKHG